jgi:hypothetical protein
MNEVNKYKKKTADENPATLSPEKNSRNTPHTKKLLLCRKKGADTGRRDKLQPSRHQEHGNA